MTANAGQTRTKISIVNNKLNNDSSESSDSHSVELLQDETSTEAVLETSTYLQAVPVPKEWREQATVVDSDKQKPRSAKKYTWPDPQSIVSTSRLLQAPVWTRQAIRLLLAIQHRRTKREWRNPLRQSCTTMDSQSATSTPITGPDKAQEAESPNPVLPPMKEGTSRGTVIQLNPYRHEGG